MKDVFYIKGMTCASCQATINNNVSRLDGVKSCNISLLTNQMEVTYQDISSKDIINLVNHLGYKASLTPFEEKRKNSLITRLIISIILMLILMYVAMGHMIPAIFPHFLHEPVLNSSLQLLLASAIIGLNFHYYISGAKHLFHLNPNMDSLVFIGSLVSYLYATYFYIIIIINKAQSLETMSYLHGLFYDSSAMILVFVSIGKLLESKSKIKAKKAVLELAKMMPNECLMVKDGKEVIANVSDVKVGDLLLIKPGDVIPLDGLVVDGISSVNEASISGEAMPVLKEKGSSLISGTTNINGLLTLEVTHLVQDSTLSVITKRVIEASNSKPNIQKLADRISLFFVPTVFLISLITFIIWLIISHNLGTSFNYAISVLVISCPCALGLATPVAVMVSSGVSAKGHLLFKEANAMEKLAAIDTILLDKTGTITKGELSVIEFKTTINKDTFISISKALEKASNHPLALALLKYSENFNTYDINIKNFNTEIGYGISAEIDGIMYYIGNKKYYERFALSYDQVENDGIMLYLFTKEAVLGHITFRDEISKNSYDGLNEFHKLGLKTVCLTGDKLSNARFLTDGGYVDEVYADLLPTDKEKILDKYIALGKKPLMVGDGINDSIALSKAYLSVGIGSGSNVAISSSDLVLTSNNLMDLANGIYLAKFTKRIIIENLFWAFCYNLIGIPIAAGALSMFGLKLTPMLASLFMSFSSVMVVLNALRIGTFKRKELINLYTYKFYVRDMMCKHCETHIKEALMSLPYVKEVTVDLKTKLVSVKTLNEASLDDLFVPVRSAGYKPEQ